MHQSIQNSSRSRSYKQRWTDRNFSARQESNRVENRRQKKQQVKDKSSARAVKVEPVKRLRTVRGQRYLKNAGYLVAHQWLKTKKLKGQRVQV